jgi:aromatic ring-opening dioxygenase catalytic subunit (LigB family)
MEMGKVLRKFREEFGCLIIGSGHLTHNLRDIISNMAKNSSTKFLALMKEFS